MITGGNWRSQTAGVFLEEGRDVSCAVQYADYVDSVPGVAIKEKPILEARNRQTTQVMQLWVAKRTRRSNSRHAGERVGQTLNGFFKAHCNSFTCFHEQVGGCVSNVVPSVRAKTYLSHRSLVRS